MCIVRGTKQSVGRATWQRTLLSTFGTLRDWKSYTGLEDASLLQESDVRVISILVKVGLTGYAGKQLEFVEGAVHSSEGDVTCKSEDAMRHS